MSEICDECGSSASQTAPVWEGKTLCDDCFMKAAANPEALQARCGGLCERCGASLDEAGTVFSKTDGVLCLNCSLKDQLSNQAKLPGAPDLCGQCGKSFGDNHVAIGWEGKALCLECFEIVKEAHPEITQFELIPLVDLGLVAGGFDGQSKLVLQTLGPDIEGWLDPPPASKEYIN